MTDQQPDLDAIQARANAATCGPWGTNRDLSAVYTVQARPRTTHLGMETDGDIATLAADRSDSESYANARFIAHAREDVPALVAAVRRLRAELAARPADATEYGIRIPDGRVLQSGDPTNHREQQDRLARYRDSWPTAELVQRSVHYSAWTAAAPAARSAAV